MTTAGHESGSAYVYLTTAAAATTAVEYPGGKMARQDVREGGGVEEGGQPGGVVGGYGYF